jgi:FkbM family methyltransferase
MAFVLHVLRQSDKFIDVGANVGSYTVLAAGAVGSRAFAVEPIPTTFGFLRRNVELNGLGERVRCLQGGLSDRRTTLRFTSELDEMDAALF